MPTVLVVDDSKFSRSRVLAALQPLGYALAEAGDGREGLAAVDQQTPDVIISDLLMPTLDGFGFLRGLRERGSSVPVIIVSADIQATSRTLCEELGAFSFLNKPFQAAELAAIVQQALRVVAAPVG